MAFAAAKAAIASALGNCVLTRQMMERVKGIEPSYEAWEAAVLPLNYTRIGPLNACLRNGGNREYTVHVPRRLHCQTHLGIRALKSVLIKNEVGRP